MAAQGSTPGDGQPKRRGGCLRGCLIALLVIFILVAGCGGGTYLLGRGYIARQLPVWEERHPALGLVVRIFRLGGEIRTTIVQMRTGAERLPGVDDKSLLPADIPVHPNPASESYSIGETGGVVFQRISGPPDDLLGFLREAMPRHGWELALEQEIPGGHLLLWLKNGRTCKAEVLEFQDRSELWLRYTDAGGQA